ncbi:MAG: DUF218 domain-containing protein [Cyanobacteria bacterium CRU_2_1]|nr:DUF218 domain-containing protein [Cyanobacteria bacterium RU_5_0]NJR57693.1 DUF218 domain-containing protein [Cyanobacteria bacterium CRU_2_1]
MEINLFQRQEIWLPTIEGWIVIALCLLFLGIVIRTNIYPFLAVTAPLKADILVVDAWLPCHALKTTAKEFYQGEYKYLITLGSPLPPGFDRLGCKSLPDSAATLLTEMGVPQERIVSLVVPISLRDRTLTAAIALREWLAQNASTVKAINLCTLGPHARRSRLFFRKTLSPQVTVGIIAAPPSNYEPKRWWQSSEGARTVFSEAIGYLYALIR